MPRRWRAGWRRKKASSPGSSAGALVAALRVAERVNDATIVFIVCDRGDRYLSTGVFN